MEDRVLRDTVVHTDVGIFSGPVEICHTSGHMNEAANQISIEDRPPSHTSSGMRMEGSLLVNYIPGISTDEVEERLLLDFVAGLGLSLHLLTIS